MKVERALAWYCHIQLDRHQQIIAATVGRDGLPQLARVPYRREGDDLYLALDADSPLLAGLRAVGPIAALLTGDDGLPLVSLNGAAEAVAEPDTVARLRAAFPQLAGDAALYRLLPDTLLPLQGAMDTRTFADGEPIVHQGEIADRFYVILAGACEVSRVTGAAPQALAQLQAGDYFGESGLLAGAPRNASVLARGSAQVASLSRTAFSTVMHHGFSTANDLARAITAAARG